MRYDETNAFFSDKHRPERAIEEVLQVIDKDAAAPGSEAGKRRLSIDETKVKEVEVSEATDEGSARAVEHRPAPNPKGDEPKAPGYGTVVPAPNPAATEGDKPDPTDDVPAPNPKSEP